MKITLPAKPTHPNFRVAIETGEWKDVIAQNEQIARAIALTLFGINPDSDTTVDISPLVDRADLF